MSWQSVRLADICFQERKIVEPGSEEAKRLRYLSLEHVESETGQILEIPKDVPEDQGKSTTFLFDENHVLYGKLRPYLNKASLPSFQGRCTTEIVPLRPREGTDRHFLAWLLRHPETVRWAMAGKTGSRMPRADMDALLNMPVALPPLKEQERIATTLNEQIAAVEKARAASQFQRSIASSLCRRHLLSTFAEVTKSTPITYPLYEVAQLQPSKSISTVGEATVEVVTTACLTEAGFDRYGVKTAQMAAKDAPDCVLSPGEILVARSNTPELVGRTAMFPGDDKPIVASDLTIRIRVGDKLLSEFLAGYLSYLYLSKYWIERAGGASGTMKKITRTQIEALPIPILPIDEQKRIAARTREVVGTASNILRAIDENVAAISALPSALLRRAFSEAL